MHTPPRRLSPHAPKRSPTFTGPDSPAAADGKRPAASADYEKLVCEMEKHGLTEAEQRQLTEEGVVDVETFTSLRDADFETSGIDIEARRQDKLRRDQAAARSRHAQAVAQKAAEHAAASEGQVQGLLDQAGLSAQGREVVRSLRNLDALRQLDLGCMAQLGLHIVDRRKLDELCASDAVRRAQAPVLERAVQEEVMTEPERVRREAAAEEEKHGLTKEEQRQLHAEHVVDVATFMALRDEDLELSGIDVKTRRQEKLERDRATVEARYQAAVARRDAAMLEQVQGLLDEAGLTAHGRELAHGVLDLDALRQLDLAGMAKLGLGAVDRRRLEAFRQTEQVLRRFCPRLWKGRRIR